MSKATISINGKVIGWTEDDFPNSFNGIFTQHQTPQVEHIIDTECTVVESKIKTVEEKHPNQYHSLGDFY